MKQRSLLKMTLTGLFVCTLMVTLSGCATVGRPTDINNACSIFRDNPEWREAIANTTAKWGTPAHIQMAIMHQESSFRHDARPGRVSVLGIPLWRKSSAYGFAQVKDGTWDWYVSKTGNRLASRDNFADASDFIGWYTDVSKRMLGLSKWDAYNQYLAYHEGHGGWKRKTFNKKAWLIKVARKVEKRAGTYASQMKSCPPGQGSSWSIWPW